MADDRQNLIEHLAQTLIYDNHILIETSHTINLRTILSDALGTFECKHECDIAFEKYGGTNNG